MKTIKLDDKNVIICQDASVLVRDLAKHIYQLAQAAIESQGRFTILLAGGSTPKALYEHLAREYKNIFPWNKTFFFIGDERCVPHDSVDSNYKMINDALFVHIPLAAENIFPTHDQDNNPELAAANYSNVIKHLFKLKEGQLPVFDLVLLGLGPDGHTASLFPGTTALAEKDRLYVANYVEKLHSYRLTATYPLLNAGREIIFLVAGENKAEIVCNVLSSERYAYPAQAVHATQGRLQWFIDQSAAKLLPETELKS